MPPRIGAFEQINDALFEAVWAGTDDLGSFEGRSAFLAKLGLGSDDLWQLATSGKVTARLSSHDDDAVERGVFGVPTVFVGKEMFFGNDRLHFAKAQLEIAQDPEAHTEWQECNCYRCGSGRRSFRSQRFSNGGYRVAMIARKEERLRQFERDIPNTKAFVVDVSDPAQLSKAMDCIREELGVPNVAIHNAVGGVLGNFMQVDPAILERNFQTNVMALFHLARRFAPMMADLDRGAIIASGNTSALRGKSDFAGFAPTKAAQRILAESLARSWSKGVHVAYVLVDAVIDLEWTRKRWPDRPDDFFIKPADIADEIWHVAHQPRGAWSFNVELRPHGELW